MSEEAFLRLVEDLAKVPLIREADVERYQGGRWLYEPACAHCGAAMTGRRLQQLSLLADGAA